MRGKVSDQDLTDYALNELGPDERFYVESMLAVSEECRHDVYQALEFGEMLKEGFEMQEGSAELLLDKAQRSRVLTIPRWQWRGLLQRAAAIALLAAGTAYAMNQPGFWNKGGDTLVKTGSAMGNLFDEAKDKGWPRTFDEYWARRIKAGAPAVLGQDLQYVTAPAVCTPPTFEMPGMPDIADR